MSDTAIRGQASNLSGALREAAFIAAASLLLGTGYTALTGKGIFGPAGGQSFQRTTHQRVTGAEAKALHDRGEALFVDARPAFDFGAGHIRGAVSLPLKDFSAGAAILELIPREQPLVTYCDGEDCNSSILLAAKLDSAGYKNVKVFFGGWKEWTTLHLPVE